VDVVSIRNCTAAAVLALATAFLASAQTPAPAIPIPGDSSLTIFLRGVEVGRMLSNLTRTDSTWTVTSTGRFGDIVLNRFEVKYDRDWQPLGMRLEVTQAERHTVLTTSFGLTTAVNEISQNGATSAKTDQISARTVVLPNNFYAAYEALAVRLAGLSAGAEIPVYVPTQAEVKLSVKDVSPETIQTPAGVVALRKFGLVLHNGASDIEAMIAVDSRNRFARLEIPSAALVVARSDLAGVSARRQTMRNPTDVDITIPSTGFNLAGTLTTPPGVGRLRHPTIVLVGGSGPADRDEAVSGTPIFAQLAGALAERGFMVLRYDKRGVGQSGGRIEVVTLEDYADDLIAAVKWLAKRDDVDNRRIAVVGHSEGGAVAMIAASKEKKISSLVLVAATGSTGADLVLEQQKHQLDLMKLPDAERQQKIALQEKVHAAVITEKGWEGVPEDVRRQADTAWFKSLLQFDPARVMPQIKQPILIVQGDLDTQVPPHHAERLAELARKRKNAPPVEAVHLPGVNHLLVKATTGEVQEYSELTDKAISPDVATTIAEWLKR
jgi:pimeloyl-ACP methyl ester carboxylesterase